ncbi:VOC family protein [Comamonas sp. JC664]|uniref:VOC family protein n=1 Tax=Comamonas sp. JC664 TaxID=2801917 RepID=UPI0036090568
MFFGISHLVLPCSDLEKATHLWRDVIGFAAARSGEGYVDIDTGSALLRLLQVPKVESQTSLRLQVADVAQAYQSLLAAGSTSRYAPMRTPELEEMACVSDADGHAIVLWRALTEDEWGFVPELPKQGEWTADAEDLLQRLLAHVPAFFRMLARRKTTRIIEQLAQRRAALSPASGSSKAISPQSAKVTRFRLVEPLRAEGINPDEYRAEFDYE